MTPGNRCRLKCKLVSHGPTPFRRMQYFANNVVCLEPAPDLSVGFPVLTSITDLTSVQIGVTNSNADKLRGSWGSFVTPTSLQLKSAYLDDGEVFLTIHETIRVGRYGLLSDAVTHVAAEGGQFPGLYFDDDVAMIARCARPDTFQVSRHVLVSGADQIAKLRRRLVEPISLERTAVA